MYSGLDYCELPLVCEMITVSECGELIKMEWLTFVIKCFMVQLQYLLFCWVQWLQLKHQHRHWKSVQHLKIVFAKQDIFLDLISVSECVFLFKQFFQKI